MATEAKAAPPTNCDSPIVGCDMPSSNTDSPVPTPLIQDDSMEPLDEPQWWNIGSYHDLSKKRCRRLHAKRGKQFDLALFYNEGRYYCMSAWCSHMGGPLHQGEIEDYKGSCHIMCPWHGYMFDLQTGKNEIGLQQQIVPVKVELREVFVFYHCELGMYPFL